MKFNKSDYTILIGILGVLIITTGIIIAGNSYLGVSNQKYSVFNHFISELGEYKYSKLANVFNICLIIGTPPLIYYYLNIIPNSSRSIQILFNLIIISIWSSTISIGVFSMDNTVIHVVLALIFFYLCFFSSILFNAYALFIYKKKISKYFISSSILVSITTLLNIIQFHQLDYTIFETLRSRPKLLTICILEWFSLLSMLIFYINSIIFFKRKNSNHL